MAFISGRVGSTMQRKQRNTGEKDQASRYGEGQHSVRARRDQYEWAQRKARRTRRAVNADDAAAPIVVREFVDHCFACGPQDGRRGTEQETQRKPQVDVLEEPERQQHQCGNDGCELHDACRTQSDDKPRHERGDDHARRRLRDDTQPDDGFANTLGIKYKRQQRQGQAVDEIDDDHRRNHGDKAFLAV